MRCRCRSYNRPQSHEDVPEVVLDMPACAPPVMERRTVCVDACIVPVVRALWSAGIWTHGSCCGHGDPAKRAVCVDLDARPRATAIVRQMGDVAQVLAWELVPEPRSRVEE